MPQTRLSIICASFDSARSVAGYLEEAHIPAPLAVSVFEQGHEHRVDAYFETSPDTQAIDDACASLGKTDIAKATTVPVPDENWVVVSQQALPPIEAGRFVVHGSHDRARVGHRHGAIEIDAGEAFGTAHHATTLGCLLAIDALARHAKPARVLDLGCGSGVLAIAAARALPHARIIATDIDPISITVATQNARRNRVGDRIDFFAATGLDHPALRAPRHFDLIVANILARPLIQLAPKMHSALARGGDLVLSGLLVPQAPEVLAAYRSAGFTLRSRRDLVGWTILTLTAR